MERIIAATIVISLAGLSAGAQQPQFLPKHLAVLRVGDGEIDLHLKQSPVFIDQFDAAGFNNAPSLSVKIPTNGPNTLFFNGHAATEGILTRSADHRLLAFAGYGGVNLLEKSGTPSLLDIGRGFCTVDAAGNVRTTIYKKHTEEEKMNPRGVVTDGTNNFWGCGNAFGTVYYNANGSAGPVAFDAVPNSRAVKIINGVLYVTLNGPDGNASDSPAGIFSFVDAHGNPAPLPQSPDSALKLTVAAQPPYTKNAGFDMNAAGTIAYMAGNAAGIQKYTNSAAGWRFAYNFAIPQNIPATDNRGAGCFGVVVDFSGPAPIVYATTTEGYEGSVCSNRVVSIVDTNAMAAVTTLAQAPNAKIAYRGIEFTPEAQPANP